MPWGGAGWGEPRSYNGVKAEGGLEHTGEGGLLGRKGKAIARPEGGM